MSAHKFVFADEAIAPTKPKWQDSIRRETNLYPRPNDIRSDFNRDYTRLLHSMAFRRLKHKTQVFFATENDHICTRMEHVNHVCSISYTLCSAFGLNTELAMAIAIGHDVGHAPFGHAGETILNRLSEEYLRKTFWHEKNSLHYVDNIETLKDEEANEKNLNLTYAVRDGIVLHCGEVDEASLKPRDTIINLNALEKSSEVSPFTWEGCVVKISDKISYIGRDIEDAITLKLLSSGSIKELIALIKKHVSTGTRIKIANTLIMHILITDLFQHSNPIDGLKFSDECYKFLVEIKDFNYRNIYSTTKIDAYKRHANNVLSTIFDTLLSFYRKENTMQDLSPKNELIYHHFPSMCEHFYYFLLKYSSNIESRSHFKNKAIYNLSSRKDYIMAIIDFISGMTDNFALRCFREIISFV